MTRKKFFAFGSFVVAMVAAAGSYHAYSSYSVAEECDLLMANVEALSMGGDPTASNTGPGDTFTCKKCAVRVKLCACKNFSPCTPDLCKDYK